jgi:predicted porin
MKKILLASIALTASASTLAGGFSMGSIGYEGYPMTRFGLVITGGQASQATTIDTGKLQGQGYAINAGPSVGDTKKSSARLGLQYHFNPRWSLDVGAVDFGDTDLSISVTPPAGKTAQQAAQDVYDASVKRGSDMTYTAGLQYRVPLTRRLDMNLGAGAAMWKDKRNITVNGTNYEFKSDGTDPYVRLGVGYRLSKNTSLTMNSEYYDLDKPVTRWDAGLAFRF